MRRKVVPNETDTADQPALAVVKHFYEAYGSGDPEAIRPLLTSDVVWHIPGHHPLAGEKHGPNEVVSFFKQLGKMRFKAEPIFFGAQGDLVVDMHRGWSEAGEGAEQMYAILYRVRDGKIAEASNFLTDQHGADAFYWRHYPLRAIPDRLA